MTNTMTSSRISSTRWSGSPESSDLSSDGSVASKKYSCMSSKFESTRSTMDAYMPIAILCAHILARLGNARPSPPPRPPAGAGGSVPSHSDTYSSACSLSPTSWTAQCVTLCSVYSGEKKGAPLSSTSNASPESRLSMYWAVPQPKTYLSTTDRTARPSMPRDVRSLRLSLGSNLPLSRRIQVSRSSGPSSTPSPSSPSLSLSSSMRRSLEGFGLLMSSIVAGIGAGLLAGCAITEIALLTS
mmetsp:Transcript_15836/g.36485  ORF Transcript_15836/g.36485 Transcript_15836/m.36485 type:complete len:242 (+) Transcript_15836:989-1714(+)